MVKIEIKNDESCWFLPTPARGNANRFLVGVLMAGTQDLIELVQKKGVFLILLCIQLFVINQRSYLIETRAFQTQFSGKNGYVEAWKSRTGCVF